jgi:flagellar hook-associated protein 2
MATSSITSSGLGSGLDVDAIVTKLIAADRSAPDTRLNATKSKAEVQISAYGSLKSAMGSLQTALTRLTSGGDLSKRTVVSSDTSILTATAAKTAQPGQTQIEVLSLARAHKLGSTAFASTSALVGAGDTTFTVGSKSFKVTATATTTVAQLRDAINSATDNVGVSATLVAEDGGTRMVLTAKNTGTANSIGVSSPLTTFSDLQTATDSQIKVDGFTRTSAYNHIANVVDGVSIDLNKVAIGTKVTLTAAADDATAADAVSGFVDAYNNLISTYSSLTAYNSSTQTAGALMGDAGVRSISQSLRSMLSASVDAGAFDTLSDIGITTNVDGTLKLNTTTLATALSNDNTSIQKLFGSSHGIATDMNGLVDGYIKSSGPIDTKLSLLNKALAKVEDDRVALDDKMAKKEELYRSQFNSLDSIVSKYKNVATYLDQMDNERYNQRSNS